MNTELLKAQQALQRARDALRSGDRSAAYHWAEQAAKLAPQLEDPWLILASVASPQASLQFVKRALQINPNSPRARKGMQWAMNRLQKVPSAQKVASKPGQLQGEKRSVMSKKAQRRFIFPALLLILGCIVIIAAAWTASTTPVLASILTGETQSAPAEVTHPQVWARVEIAKPAHTSEAALVAFAAEPTSPPPTASPTLAPALESPGTSVPVPPTTTTESVPSAVPTATSTPAGSLVMDILEDTPVPTALPTSAVPTAQAKIQPPVASGVRWIEVNLSEQRVYAWQGDTLMNSFLVSTGTWQTPTVVGTFHIWNKTRIQTMSGPGYSLPNVPYVMYFYEDYGFHGTYWHNNFGTPMSHGCVNLTIPDSEWLYSFANIGTTVKVHY